MEKGLFHCLTPPVWEGDPAESEQMCGNFLYLLKAQEREWQFWWVGAFFASGMTCSCFHCCFLLAIIDLSVITVILLIRK